MSTPVKSPCIDVCRFAGPNGWCIACGRTLDEARTWRKLSPFARKRVLKELPRRLLRMEKAP